MAAATTFVSTLVSNPKTNTSSCFNGIPLANPTSLVSKPNQRKFSVSASAAANPPYDLKSFKFEAIKESIVAREMTRRYMTDMITFADTDVVVVGAGSAGLSCAYELSKNPNVQVFSLSLSLLSIMCLFRLFLHVLVSEIPI